MGWTKFSFCLLSAVLALLTSGCDGSRTDEEYLNFATEYYQSGDVPAAVIELKNAVKQNPSNSKARRLLGDVYFSSGYPDDAEKELARAIELGETDSAVRLLHLRSLYAQARFDELLDTSSALDIEEPKRASFTALEGMAFLARGETEKSTVSIEQALAQDEDNFLGLLGLSLLKLQQKELDAAVAALESALQIEPESATAWSLLGEIHTLRGDTEIAIANYDKAIELRINNAGDRLKRAWLLMDLKQYAAARKELKQLTKAQPKNGMVDFAWGYLEYRQENYAKAQTHLEQAANKAPGLQQVHLYLGLVYQLQGHSDQARASIQIYLSSTPESVEGRLALASIQINYNDYAEVEELLRPIVDSGAAEEEGTIRLLAQALLAQGKTDEGMSYLLRISPSEADSAESRIALAHGLLLSGELETGMETLQASVAKYPAHDQSHIALITSYISIGQLDQAMIAANEYIRLQPQQAMPFNLLGIALQGKGDLPGAIDNFNTALRLAPGDVSASRNLATIYLAQGEKERARDVLQEALKHNNDELNLLMELARLSLFVGESAEAERLVLQARTAHPQALQPRIILSQILSEKGDTAAAVQQLNEVAQNYSDNPRWLLQMGLLQLEMGQSSSAIQNFQKLARVDPESDDPHLLMARAYAAIGDTVRMEAELRGVLERTPNNVTAGIILCRHLINFSQAEEAEKRLVVLETTAPNHPEVLALRGMLELGRNQHKAAEKAFTKVAEIAPSGQIMVFLARSQWLAGDHKAALSTLSNWLEKEPLDGLVRLELANKQLAMRDYTEARDHYERLLEQDSGHILALNNLAYLWKEDDPQRALSYAQRAIEIAPDAPAVIDTAAELLIVNGDVKGALRLLRAAREESPNDPILAYRYAQACAEDGNINEARTVLRGLQDTDAFPLKDDAIRLLQKLDNIGGS